jgi:energy-converting hydrogenase Eha subunit C
MKTATQSGMSCFVVLSGKLDIAMAGLSGEQVILVIPNSCGMASICKRIGKERHA